MKIGDIIGYTAQRDTRYSGEPRITRREVLKRRDAKRAHKRKLEVELWDAPLRGCGWNHVVPGGERITKNFLPRGTHERAKGEWVEPLEWQVDLGKPLTHHPVTGEKLAPAPDVGAPIANECAKIPAGTREKVLERKYGKPMPLSYAQAVQHGMITEK